MKEVIKAATYALLTAGVVGPVYAQPDTQPQDEGEDIDPPRGMEEVRVTGSFIRGLQQEDIASPLLSIGREEMTNIGATRLSDIVNNLTINTGSENNPDAFTQNFSTGTSNINLRGLGVASTLVLLNGRRQTYSAVTTNQGENFVDTSSLVPLIAVDRVEILKDGAASLYGSDAVAGVANFHTRNNFEGVELEVDYLSGDYNQEETRLSAIFGVGGDSTHFMLAASLFDRSGLSTEDKRLSGPMDEISRSGFPGSFLIPTLPSGPGTVPNYWTEAYDNYAADPATGEPIPNVSDGFADFVEFDTQTIQELGLTPPVVADPNCGAVATQYSTSIPSDIIPSEAVPDGLCLFDFGSYYSLVPDEERAQVYSTFRHRFTDKLEFDAEIGFADNEAKRRNSPSFPMANFPVVPAEHPENPFGTDVQFIGRLKGSGADALISNHTSETSRIAAGLTGELSKTWTWDADITHSRNEYTLTAKDALRSQLQIALNAGTYNPFAAAPPTEPNANSESVIDSLLGDFVMDTEAELTTFGAVVTGEWFELSGGAAGVATGIQQREETLAYDYDENANANNFMFFIGNPDFEADRDITSAFGELSMPFTDAIDIQLSVRSEDYGDGVDSTDPKAALHWHPSDNFSLRASLSESFRAPSLFQQAGIQTILEETETPIGDQFYPVRSQPNPADPLKPEEADVSNIGVSWLSDSKAFEFSADYWAYDYTDVIIKQSHQAVFNAAFSATPDPQALSQIQFQEGSAPSPLTIQTINIYYDNASSLETDGIDLHASYEWLAGSSHIRVGGDLTKILTYDLVDPQAGSVDGLGNRNFTNFATSVPELRANLNFHWSTARHAVNAYWRHIDSYMDDQNGNATIDSHTTVDLQYRYNIGAIGGTTKPVNIAVGALNATDEDPPYVSTNGGYDSKVHDPRGRLFYLRLNVPL